jgi:hypothetical protein
MKKLALAACLAVISCTTSLVATTDASAESCTWLSATASGSDTTAVTKAARREVGGHQKVLALRGYRGAGKPISWCTFNSGRFDCTVQIRVCQSG